MVEFVHHFKSKILLCGEVHLSLVGCVLQDDVGSSPCMRISTKQLAVQDFVHHFKSKFLL